MSCGHIGAGQGRGRKLPVRRFVDRPTTLRQRFYVRDCAVEIPKSRMGEGIYVRVEDIRR